MEGSIGNDSDKPLFRRKHPNLLRIQQELTPSSPVCVVRDRDQPAEGYLKRRSADEVHSFSSQTSHEKAVEILQCKALKNEDLAPSLRQEITLSIGASRLLQKRQRKTC